jgi:hypothetical protein
MKAILCRLYILSKKRRNKTEQPAEGYNWKKGAHSAKSGNYHIGQRLAHLDKLNFGNSIARLPSWGAR